MSETTTAIGTATKSALCLILPEPAAGIINEIRRLHDPAYPHCNLLFPFVTDQKFDEIAPLIGTALADCKPLRVKLDKFGYFDHGKTATLYLEPEIVEEDNKRQAKGLGHIYNVVSRMFPQCVKEARAFHPHLTVGKFKGEASAKQAQDKFQSSWKPMTWLVDAVYLISRADFDDPFHIRHKIMLGQGAADCKLSASSSLGAVNCADGQVSPLRSGGGDMKRVLDDDGEAKEVDIGDDGEGDEHVLYKEEAALYRFDQDTKEWKQRGQGYVKLLQHKDTKKIRVILRQHKTLKIRMNHLVSPSIEMKANAGNDRSWTWSTTDFADDPDKGKTEVLAIRFTTSDVANKYKEMHDTCRKINSSHNLSASGAVGGVCKLLPTKLLVSVPAALVEQQSEKDAKDSKDAKRILEPLVIVALDCSGSMGADYALAVDGCRLILSQYLEGSAPISSVDFVTFGYSVKSSQLTKTTFRTALDREASRATLGTLEGSTWLAGVICYLEEQVAKLMLASSSCSSSSSQQRRRPVHIVLLTDGLETKTNKAHVESALTALTLRIRNYGVEHSHLDCIGFTHYHDVALLNQLVSCAGTHGSFQYADNSAKLQSALQMIAKVQCHVEQRVKGQLTLGTTSVGVELTLNEVTGDYEGIVALRRQRDDESKEPNTSSSNNNKATLNLAMSSASTAAVTIELRVEAASQAEQLLTELDDLSAALPLLANRCAKEHASEAYRREVLQLDDDIDAFRVRAARIRDRELRRSLLTQSLELKPPLSALLAALRASTVTLGGDRLASLLSSAHSVALKRSVAKRVDRRIMENLKQQTFRDKAIESAVAKVRDMDAKIKQQQQQDKSSQGGGDDGGSPSSDIVTLWEEPQCMLTLTTPAEAPLDAGDCLALCLSVRRSAATAVDPSQLTIHSITSSYLSHRAFCEGVEDALIRMDDAPDAAAQVLGDFKRNEGQQAFKVLAHEKINATLPLYINERHWTVAQHRMREAMALACVGNPTASTFSQVTTVPFLVLMHALRQWLAAPTVERHLVHAMQVYQTCCAIMQTFNNDSNRLMASVDTTVDSIIQSPSARTVDIVPSYGVLMGQVLSSSSDIKMNKDRLRQFVACAADELLRRTMDLRHRQATSAEVTALLEHVLDIDYDLYAVDDKKKELEHKSLSNYGDGVRQHFEQERKRIKIDGKERSESSTTEDKDGGSSNSRDGNKGLNDRREYQAADTCSDQGKQVARLMTGGQTRTATTIKADLSDMSLLGDLVVFDTLLSSGVLPVLCRAGLEQTKKERLVERLVLPLMSVKSQWTLSMNLVSALETLALPHTAVVVTALVAQSLRDHTNSVRRHSIENKSYWDPFDTATATEAVTHIGRQLVQERRAALAAAAATQQANDVSGVFAATTDLYEAAGCVRQCSHIGAPLFRRLFTALQSSSARLAWTKWRMLTDACWTPDVSLAPITVLNMPWPASKRNCNKMHRLHPDPSKS